MDFNPTQALEMFIPKNQTLRQAITADFRRLKRIAYYSRQYKTRFPEWNFRKCARNAEMLVDSLIILETWNQENPDLPV
jgi:hypothetical protein